MKIAVAAAVIRDGRKRGASQILEEILEEDQDFESSGMEEEELVLKRKLIRKGQTFTLAP